MNIGFIAKKYVKEQALSHLDVELILASVLEKSREFVLSHPEFDLSPVKARKIRLLIQKRQRGVPMAYLTGKKESFGLDFQVDQNVLIPRPETEMLVEEAIKECQKSKVKSQKSIIIDVGTGSGNIIISIVKNLINQSSVIGHPKFFATDISQRALSIAKKNAKFHNVDKNIKFIRGNLLEPIIGNWKLGIGNSRIIILANLPYVSEKNYLKYFSQIKFEPRSALLSENCGLLNYEKLFQQIKKMFVLCSPLHVSCIIEFSPEQKIQLSKLIKKYFPESKMEFKKDLASKWRMGKIIL